MRSLVLGSESDPPQLLADTALGESTVSRLVEDDLFRGPLTAPVGRPPAEGLDTPGTTP